MDIHVRHPAAGTLFVIISVAVSWRLWPRLPLCASDALFLQAPSGLSGLTGGGSTVSFLWPWICSPPSIAVVLLVPGWDVQDTPTLRSDEWTTM